MDIDNRLRSEMKNFSIQTVQKLSVLKYCHIGKFIFQTYIIHFFLSTSALSPRGRPTFAARQK